MKTLSLILVIGRKDALFWTEGEQAPPRPRQVSQTILGVIITISPIKNAKNILKCA